MDPYFINAKVYPRPLLSTTSDPTFEKVPCILMIINYLQYL